MIICLDVFEYKFIYKWVLIVIIMNDKMHKKFRKRLLNARRHKATATTGLLERKQTLIFCGLRHTF